MSTTEKTVRMAATLYEIRDATRRLLGDKYPAKMAEMGKVVAQFAKMHGTNELAAAQWMVDQLEMRGNDVTTMLVLAAAVELIEPSPL